MKTIYSSSPHPEGYISTSHILFLSYITHITSQGRVFWYCPENEKIVKYEPRQEHQDQ